MKGKTILILMYILFTIVLIIFIDFSKDASEMVYNLSALSATTITILNTFLAVKLIDYLMKNFNNKVI
jgi:hypothetical protein